jgi:hypothetical protein
MAAMSRSIRSRRVIALIAAYAVALHALLLPLSVVAGGTSSSVICTAGASVESSQLPASHDTGCPCAAGCGMQCCIDTLAGPPQVAIAFELTSVTKIKPAPAVEPGIRLAHRNPQVPRAPPAA